MLKHGGSWKKLSIIVSEYVPIFFTFASHNAVFQIRLYFSQKEIFRLKLINLFG